MDRAPHQFSFSSRIVGLCALGALIALNSCSSTQKKTTSQDLPGVEAPAVPAYGPSEAMGPPAPDASTGAAPLEPMVNVGPQPLRSKSLVLVLGPGMAQGMSYIGAIRALSDAKIPIGSVLGTEMGGVVGALYALHGSANSLEWSMLRLKDEVLKKNPSDLLSRVLNKNRASEKLEAELTRAFGQKDLIQMRLPLRLSLQPKESSAPQLMDHGAVVPMLLETYQPVPPRVSQSLAQMLVDEAVKLSAGPVLVLQTGEPTVNGGDLLISIPMKGIGPEDFSRRTESIFQGKKAVQAKLPEIRRLLSP